MSHSLKVCWPTHVERRKLGAVGVEGLVVELGELLYIEEVSIRRCRELLYCEELTGDCVEV